MMASPTIPIQFASDVLSNTVIQVGIQADGFPLSSRIISGSGSRGADLTALQIANGVRFTPLSAATARTEGALEWGELVFQWFTTEPIATNALPPGTPKK